MRMLIIYLCIGWIMSSCTHKTSTSTSIYVLSDRTSKDIPAPNINHVYELVDDIDEMNDAVSFSYQVIGNTDISKRYSLSLAAASWSENKLKRSHQVSQFFDAIDTLFQRQISKTYEFKNSHIIIPLVKSLEYISQSATTNKTVILYSDLIEHSPLYNGYATSHRHVMQKEFDTLVASFQSNLKVNDFNGITLYIIYYPSTPFQNERFNDFCKLYRAVFKNTGLDIRVGMNHTIPINHEN